MPGTGKNCVGGPPLSKKRRVISINVSHNVCFQPWKGPETPDRGPVCDFPGYRPLAKSVSMACVQQCS